MKRPRLLWPSDAIARAPFSIYAKLLAAFLVIVGLLIAVGAVSLAELAAVNRRAEDQVKLQRKIAAYRQTQQDTMSQLYSVSSALLVPDNRTLDATVRQLNQFGYDLDRLQFVAADEVELFGRVRKDYEAFIGIVGEVVELVRAGKGAEGREAQIGRAGPLAERLERLTNELVNKAEADMVARVDEGHAAYVTSRRLVVAFALGSILLALGLGYSLSWSLIGPVKQMESRFAQIASGNFTTRIEVRNRDELGALAANLNQMSAELGSLYRQVEIANRNKSEFLANMSHELRTPLNSLLILSKMLSENKDQNLTPDQVKYAGTVYSAGCDLLALINEILDLSKVEAGKMPIDPKDVKVVEIQDYLEQSFRPVAEHKGLDFTLTVAREVPRVVYTDTNRLQQILKNLLSNAFKFTEKGKVEMRIGLAKDKAFPMEALKDGPVIAFVVTDTGIGIPPEKQKLIFEAFQQADGTTSRKYGGTGLGLTISREIARLLGGMIEVESVPGQGSTFTLYLPANYSSGDLQVHDSESEPALDVPPLPVDANFEGKHVLIVDDDMRNIFAITSVLEARGMKVIFAENGKVAMKMLEQHPHVDLVLMDTMMPEMDGIEATGVIRANPSFTNLPIISLTAKAMKGDREKCIEAGASDYVTKPVDPDRLLSLIHIWLEKSES